MTNLFRFKDNPIDRIVFGIILIAVLLYNGFSNNFSSAEAIGTSTFNIVLLILCIWLIISGAKKFIRDKRKSKM